MRSLDLLGVGGDSSIEYSKSWRFVVSITISFMRVGSRYGVLYLEIWNFVYFPIASSQVNDEKEKMQSTSYQLFLLLLDQREVEVSNLNEVVLFIWWWATFRLLRSFSWRMPWGDLGCCYPSDKEASPIHANPYELAMAWVQKLYQLSILDLCSFLLLIWKRPRDGKSQLGMQCAPSCS